MCDCVLLLLYNYAHLFVQELWKFGTTVILYSLKYMYGTTVRWVIRDFVNCAHISVILISIICDLLSENLTSLLFLRLLFTGYLLSRGENQ